MAAAVIDYAVAQHDRNSSLTFFPRFEAWQPGDVLLCHTAVAANFGSFFVPSLHAPTGWASLLSRAYGGSSGFRIQSWEYKIVGGETSFVFDGGGVDTIDGPVAGVLLLVRGVDPANPYYDGFTWGAAPAGVVPAAYGAIFTPGSPGVDYVLPTWLGSITPYAQAYTPTAGLVVTTGYQRNEIGMSTPSYSERMDSTPIANSVIIPYFLMPDSPVVTPPPGLVRLPEQAHVAEVRAGATLRPSTRVA